MKIKNILYFALAGLFLTVLGSCEKDNYKAPSSTLTGNVQFEGKNVGLRSGGVQLELWQHNYELFNKIPVFVDQDGSFSAEVFDGDYKLALVRGNGPWADNVDSLDVKVRGNTEINVPVQLYYSIEQENFQRNGAEISASVQLKKGSADQPLERVRLFAGQTVLLDNVINVGSSEINGADVELQQPVSLSLTLPQSLLDKGYAFVRIGVKAQGAAEYVYGTATRIDLN